MPHGCQKRKKVTTVISSRRAEGAAREREIRLNSLLTAPKGEKETTRRGRRRFTTGFLKDLVCERQKSGKTGLVLGNLRQRKKKKRKKKSLRSALAG